jgi:hypothetical protein
MKWFKRQTSNKSGKQKIRAKLGLLMRAIILISVFLRQHPSFFRMRLQEVGVGIVKDIWVLGALTSPDQPERIKAL